MEEAANRYFIMMTESVEHKVFATEDEYKEFLKNYSKNNQNPKNRYVYGDFKEVLKSEGVTFNSTFFISDIFKINDIKELGLLPMSSIALGDYFGYNHDHDENRLVDIDKLMEDNIFKFCECDCNDIIFDNEPPVEEAEISF